MEEEKKKKVFIYTMETVSKLLGGMPVDYYVGFDLDAIRKVVNILGGVYVNVEVPVRVKTKWVDINLKPGYQKLNGIETLYYALWRKTPGGDIDRIKRDKELILSVFQQLKESNKIIKLPEIYWKIRKHFFTNLSLQQITSLAYFAQSINKEDMVFESIPGTYFNYAGVSYWKPDYEGIKKLVKDLLGYDIEIDLQLPERFKYVPRIVKHKNTNSSKKTINQNLQTTNQENQKKQKNKLSKVVQLILPCLYKIQKLFQLLIIIQQFSNLHKNWKVSKPCHPKIDSRDCTKNKNSYLLSKKVLQFLHPLM